MSFYSHKKSIQNQAHKSDQNKKKRRKILFYMLNVQTAKARVSIIAHAKRILTAR